MNTRDLEMEWQQLITERHRKLRKLGKMQRRIDSLERQIKEHQKAQEAMFDTDDDIHHPRIVHPRAS